MQFSVLELQIFYIKLEKCIFVENATHSPPPGRDSGHYPCFLSAKKHTYSMKSALLEQQTMGKNCHGICAKRTKMQKQFLSKVVDNDMK